MDTRDLRRERAELFEKSKAMVDRAEREKRTLNASEQLEFDRFTKRMDDLRKTIDAAETVRDEGAYLAQSRGRKSDTRIVDATHATQADLALRAWALGPSHARPEHIEAAERVGLRYTASELELRALSSVTATQGQASIPDEMMAAYWDAQKWYGSVRSVATVLTTTTGAPLPIPTTDDTANTGEIIADGGAVTTTVDPAFGQVVLHPFKFSSKAIIVPIELLQDSSINLAVYLGAKLGERIARVQNTKYTVGAGTTEPFGVQVQAALGKTAAATNAITFDEVIDLYHSADVAYRRRPGTRFMMADTTAAYLRKLKDSQNRYLWEMSVQVGQPDRILGVPVEINNDMDSAFSTNKRLVLFGDFGAYHIQEAGSVTILRSDDVRILNHQCVFLGYHRTDGALAEANAIRYLRTA